MGKVICSRAQERFQVFNENGTVRLCGWCDDNIVGNLLDHTVEEIYCGELAMRLKDRHAAKDYSLCNPDACGYVAKGTIGEVLVPYERERRYPKSLALGFERVCNYRCPCCTVHGCMKENRDKDIENNYRIIKKRLEEAMPYATHLEANGCGELFVSHHTLDLLSTWKPLADRKDCFVSLETNGSLFDEEHWKIIENLGQYKLEVSISVMSFEEEIYQYLSGCSYPIDKIINNLKFVKGLREKGIIDYLQLCTVVQERNFRDLPGFTRRCLEEFGADIVRLRPYHPWGAERRDEAWYKDIRVSDHPMHNEYKRVMSNPIFQNPKVSDDSGGRDSSWTSCSPYQMELKNEEVMAKIVTNPDELAAKLKELFGDKSVVVYGTEAMGKILARELIRMNYNMPYIISYQGDMREYFGKSVTNLCDLDFSEKEEAVVITPMHAERKIRYEMKKHGFKDIVSVWELMVK